MTIQVYRRNKIFFLSELSKRHCSIEVILTRFKDKYLLVVNLNKQYNIIIKIYNVVMLILKL